MTATKLSVGGHSRSGCRFVACFVLLAFTLQSYFTQSHLHDRSQGFTITAAVKMAGNAPAHRKAPIEDNTLNCSICQAVAHAGAFLMPASLPLLPALFAEQAALIVTVHAVASAAPHDWRSRAPPQG